MLSPALWVPPPALPPQVCAHKWCDLGEPDYGVALLNDSKYGHATHGSTQRLTLLKSPKAPDEGTDMGTHTFRYALWPHALGCAHLPAPPDTHGGGGPQRSPCQACSFPSRLSQLHRAVCEGRPRGCLHVRSAGGRRAAWWQRAWPSTAPLCWWALPPCGARCPAHGCAFTPTSPCSRCASAPQGMPRLPSWTLSLAPW